MGGSRFSIQGSYTPLSVTVDAPCSRALQYGLSGSTGHTKPPLHTKIRLFVILVQIDLHLTNIFKAISLVKAMANKTAIHKTPLSLLVRLLEWPLDKPPRGTFSFMLWVRA